MGVEAARGSRAVFVFSVVSLRRGRGASVPRHAASMNSAQRSAIMIVGAFVLPDTMHGITGASLSRNPSNHRSVESRTSAVQAGDAPWTPSDRAGHVDLADIVVIEPHADRFAEQCELRERRRARDRCGDRRPRDLPCQRDRGRLRAVLDVQLEQMDSAMLMRFFDPCVLPFWLDILPATHRAYLAQGVRNRIHLDTGLQIRAAEIGAPENVMHATEFPLQLTQAQEDGLMAACYP